MSKPMKASITATTACRSPGWNTAEKKPLPWQNAFNLVSDLREGITGFAENEGEDEWDGGEWFGGDDEDGFCAWTTGDGGPRFCWKDDA